MVIVGFCVRGAIEKEIDREESGLLPGDGWKKNRKAAGILLILGIIGIHGLHRFYVGKNVMGLLMLLTFGGLFIWSLFDLVAVLRGQFTDCYGRQLTTARSDVIVILGVFLVLLTLMGWCYLPVFQ
ncbi:MAG: TM2 domain-containing protein [Chloroflexi bacterium]|nr:TM2 domain-containing protein [Chloroflexota bacterium]